MSTTSKTRASKTRCETVDQTLTWTDDNGHLNVESGDLIEVNGEFELVDCVGFDPANDNVVGYSLADRDGIAFVPRDDRVKVFRYIETTEE